ncbi:MAG: hypothetical protein CMJ58_06880 [Planctomycetaceae bacterium]|nr:hypothetical protein [Planctomycetaceae bacterium]
MNLTLNDQERDFLLELLQWRAGELHPEIRRCMDHVYKDELKSKLQRCEALRERLKTCAAGVD